MFRFIADSLRAKGLIRTIDEFVEGAQHAFTNQSIHVEHVGAVYNYTAWLKPNVGSFEQIKTARYFVIGTRESDGEVVMWYKPNCAHPHLYPTQKDIETEMPMYEEVDGEKVYKTDMAGIEVFRSVPSGTPGVQAFEENRLSIEDTHNLLQQMIDLHPDLFGSVAREWWQAWADSTPRNHVAEIALRPLTFTWPAKASNWQAPNLQGLRSEYEESVTYINSKGRQSFNVAAAQQAAAEQRDKSPALSVGDLVLVRPGEDEGMHRLPFWIAEVTEAVPTEVDAIPVAWRTPFKRGQAQDDVEGQWVHICIGAARSRSGRTRYHPYTKKCKNGLNNKQGHGQMAGTVQRNEVALYFPSLTNKTSHMCVPRLAAHHVL